MGKTGKKTREYLNDYLSIKRMLYGQEKLVETLRGSLYTLPASGSSVKGNGIGDPTGNKVLRLAEEEYMLQQMKTMLTWRRNMIDAYFSTISDPMIKLILFQHYIMGRTWKQISVRDGAGQSEDSIRMMAVRYTNRHPITWLT